MALSQRLEFRQTQALVMTPQLMQAIKLLQLSSLDLAAYVDGELERNPLLERASDDDAPGPEAEAEASRASADRDDGTSTPDWIGSDLETSRTSMEQGLGTELENVFPDDGGPTSAHPEMPPPAYSEWSGSGSAGGGADSNYNLEAFVSAETTLAAHLAEQMALAIPDPAQRMIGQYLIDMVDEAGYLTGDLAQMASIALGIYVIVTWGQIQRYRDRPLYRLTFGCPTYVMAMMSGVLIAFIMTSVNVWAAPYAMRVLGMSPVRIIQTRARFPASR